MTAFDSQSAGPKQTFAVDNMYAVDMATGLDFLQRFYRKIKKSVASDHGRSWGVHNQMMSVYIIEVRYYNMLV